MIRTRVLRAAPTIDTDGHTVTVRLVGWDEPAEVTDNGRDFYSESFQRGGLKPPAKLLGELEHDGPLVAASTTVEDRPDGLYAVARISRSAKGRDLVADMDAGIYEHVSVDFDDDPTPVPDGGSIKRSTAQLRRFAFTTSPQHTGARVVGRRSTTGETTMGDTLTAQTDDTNTSTDTTDPTNTDDTNTSTDTTDHQRSTPQQRAEPPRPGQRQQNAPVRAGGRFRSLGHFAHAAANGEVEGDELARYNRALDAAVLADIPGLIQEQWITEIIDLQRSYTPTIEEFASRPLPDTGTSVIQPRVKVRPTVAKQSSENAQPSSRAVEIEQVSWAVETFAGGQNMSLQTIKRSDPSYLNEVMRLHIIEMAEAKNARAVALLEAIDYDTNSTRVTKTADYTDGKFVDDLTDAAAGMLNTLKRFPEVVLIPTNVWVVLSKAKDSDGRPIYPSMSPMNPAGTMSLKSPNGAVRDLSYRVEPELSDDQILVGVREAFRSFSSGVETMTADTPSTLGRDVAVYSFSAMGAADERGLWLIAPDEE
jgi:HK97 family phage major capsid protein